MTIFLDTSDVANRTYFEIKADEHEPKISEIILFYSSDVIYLTWYKTIKFYWYFYLSYLPRDFLFYKENKLDCLLAAFYCS